MIRQARNTDLAAIAQVERLSWPVGMAAGEAQLAARLATFPDGQLVEETAGRIVGYAAAQRISAGRLDQEPLTYATLTDGGTFAASHDPRGAVYQLIGVAVLPAERGSGVARALVDRQIEQARATPGVRRILGFTRPAGFWRHADLSIERYLALRGAQGQLIDPVLAFHLNAGARVVSLHPGFRPEDLESRGYGVLIEYPIDLE